MTARLVWYIKRLRVMGPLEIMHRMGQQMTLIALLVQYRLGIPGPVRQLRDPTALRFCAARSLQLPLLRFNLASLQLAAPALLRGEVPVFGQAWQWQDRAGIWHQAPDTQRQWPQIFFAGIAYREGNPHGDIRKLWEPARLQHLLDLAVIARSSAGTGRKQAVNLVQRQLASWVADNPPLTGAHYVCAMECALRLIALCHALDLLRKDLQQEVAPWAGICHVVSSHAPLIARRLSLHSSTGNHTTAEAAALVYAGVLFSELKGAGHWLSTGLAILESLSESQVLEDGGGVEQALTYHNFNIQLFGLVNGLLSHHGRYVPCAIVSAVQRGNRFLAAMAAGDGTLPAIGDSDGGCALSRHLLPLEAPGQQGQQMPAGQPDAMQQSPNRTFRDSGYTLARINTRPDIRLIFDHGALGMPPSCGHGHADSLSLTLSLGNRDILLDTGTYTYTGDQRWRRYFRGTSAHNTVTVNNTDQASQQACFLWARPFRSRVLAADISDPRYGRIMAAHDGYSPQGVRHIRSLTWKQGQWLLIRDDLLGEGTHRLDLHWHLGVEPGQTEPGLFELTTPVARLTMQCTGGAITTHRGERFPLLGWRSPAYGEVEPCTTIRLRHEGALPHTFTTLIRLPAESEAVTGDQSIEEALTWIAEQTRIANGHRNA